ncbi:MAG TPA: carbohydrate-binding protein [Niastella sp.]|nr:carbohydrate-binding protein [Niastella sp.]
MKQMLHYSVRVFFFCVLCTVFFTFHARAKPPYKWPDNRNTATEKFVKVNIYGGTNPYNNSEWTDWNLGTASSTNKSISALKYSDGTASPVTAVLSKTDAIGDNGTTYGGTMAPAEVLRYCSNGTAERTITLSNLSTAKTYALELYASRAKTGYATVFTINATTVTVNTDNNISNKAAFSNLIPNAYGQIIVTIKSGTTTNATAYNYLNGFTLTEIGDDTTPGNQLPTANAGTDKSLTLPTNSTSLTGSGSDAEGSITFYWTQVSGPNTAALNNATVATATASGLIQGTYIFRLTVTDNSGASVYDDVAITVNSNTPTTASVFDPNDIVKTYDPANPPTKPATGIVGKWVRTPRVSWSTSDFKCYIYNGMAFRLKYPKNYDSTKAYPILIFFHGLGEYGTIYDNEYQLYLGGQAHSNAVNNGKFDGFLLYPQHTSEFWSSGNISNVYNLLEKIMIPQKLVDPFRVYVNGLSAGGTTTWTFLSRYTKLVAAATPISSAANYLFDSAQKYKFTPIYHFQGQLDPDPTPTDAKNLGNKILGIGGNYKYKEFANRAHDCWNQAWAEPDYFTFYNTAYKSNPWPLFGRTEFCEGDPIGITLGVTADFDGYEWRKDGVLITGANTNEITVNELGTYDCRIKRGNDWSLWSPKPIVVRLKPLTKQPSITITGLATNVIPAPDGSTTVPLEVPDGYATYNWQKEGSSTILSTSRTLNAATAGNYKVQITEKYGCGLDTAATTIPVATSRIQAEAYVAMLGVKKETCTDAGGGEDVGYIDLNDWIDYSIAAPITGNYTFKFRLASGTTGAQFQVQNAGGSVLATVNVPGTGGWQKYVDVTTAFPLTEGTQTIRLFSIATPRFNINYFDFTNPAGTTGGSDGFSKPFLVVDATAANGPDPVSNLTATGTSKTAIQLNWNQTSAPAFNETAFEVYEATAADGPYVLKTITAANATGATFSNLNSGTTYYYKVRAVNNNAASAVAGPASALTFTDNSAPTTPLNLRAGGTGRSTIDLLWDAASDDVGVTNYDIYINGVKTYAVAKVTKATVYNLQPSKAYSFQIRARDLSGNVSALSNTITASTTSGYLKLDPAMGSNPNNYSVYMNLNLENPATFPWNNTNVLPSEGTVFGSLKNYASNNSGMKMTITDNFSGYNPGGMNTGNNSGVYPDNVMRSMYYNSPGQVAKLLFSGLSLNHKYSFVFFGSRAGTGDRTGVYKIGTQQVSLNASNNTTQTVQIDNVVPDQNGNVVVEISLGSTAMFAYLNSVVIKAYSQMATTSAVTSVNNVGVEEVSHVAATAYPNPTENEVQLNVPLSKPVTMLTVTISNASGSIVSTQYFKNLAQGTWQQRLRLNEKASQPGMYYIQLSGLPGGKSQVLKVMKLK